MNTVEQKQAELEAAWNELQSVASYVEEQSAKFASEPLEEQPVEPHTTAPAWWLNNDSVW